MTIDDEQELRTRTAGLPMAWRAMKTEPFTGEDPTDYLPLIEAAHIVADEARATLARWVDAGRRGGVSWSEIGTVVGTSRQAAQQRFGAADEDEPPAGTVSVRLGATAFNEMTILASEGAAGRELIATGALRLYFRQTARPWAYVRTVGPIDAARRSAEGWEPASSWFVFHYYKRPA